MSSTTAAIVLYNLRMAGHYLQALNSPDDSTLNDMDDSEYQDFISICGVLHTYSEMYLSTAGSLSPAPEKIDLSAEPESPTQAPLPTPGYLPELPYLRRVDSKLLDRPMQCWRCKKFFAVPIVNLEDLQDGLFEKFQHRGKDACQSWNGYNPRLVMVEFTQGRRVKSYIGTKIEDPRIDRPLR